MNKITFAANPDTNYIFHMLSVARCGYDNAYGRSFRDRYPAADLQIIKDNEQMLSVCGGAHCGALYYLMVCVPARAETSAKVYYSQLMREVEENSLPEEYAPYAGVIKAVASVMVKHYDRYISDIWERDRQKIEAYIPQLLEEFTRLNFTDKAETVVGHKLSTDRFIATLVTSVENGAEAIDISDEQDVFGVERSVMDSVYFIGHEFIIYLLFDALREENAFRNFDTWALTEGLAEYYLKKIMGDTRFFNRQRKYVEFYESCEGDLSAAELYRMAIDAGRANR